MRSPDGTPVKVVTLLAKSGIVIRRDAEFQNFGAKRKARNSKCHRDLIQSTLLTH